MHGAGAVKKRQQSCCNDVVEVINAENKLFGFQRALKASRLTPAAITEEAQDFG